MSCKVLQQANKVDNDQEGGSGFAYRQTFCAGQRTWSASRGCFSPPSSGTPACSVGGVYPPSPMCSRCIPEDRLAGAHLRDTQKEESNFYTHRPDEHLELTTWVKSR